MAGRHAKLTFPQLRRIDSWFSERKWSAMVMCRMLGISIKTLYDAANRRGGYKEIARG